VTAPEGRVPTGIAGLDGLLGGGFPPGRVILVLGEPSAGHTILDSQFLMNGINKFGENGLLVSMEESKSYYEWEMHQYGMDFAIAEKQGKFSFVDASPVRAIPGEVKIGKLTIGRQDFSLLSLLQLIRNNAKTINAKRVVLDPISMLIFQYPDETQRRKALLNIVEAMTETGATCIFSSELRNASPKGRRLQTEEYLVHGVILMQTTAAGNKIAHTIQIDRMRGTPIDRQPRPYRISDRGIEVYPEDNVI
jgi:circadian clock protein KaiC